MGMCLSLTAEIAKGPFGSCETIVDRAEPSVADVLGRLAAVVEAWERPYPQRVRVVMPCGWRRVPRSMICISPIDRATTCAHRSCCPTMPSSGWRVSPASHGVMCGVPAMPTWTMRIRLSRRFRGGAPTSPRQSPRGCTPDVEMARPQSSADPWHHPAIEARMRVSARSTIGMDARPWEATWACARLIMGHASWLRSRSPMASMMAATSTVRTMMTPCRAGATHLYAAAGRRGGSNTAGDPDDATQLRTASMPPSIRAGTLPPSAT
jgi:hypothetical protein